MGKIRFLLALSVVAAHCGAIWRFNMLGGRNAVEAFFIISGFYMSLVLNDKYTGANSSYRLFITNRYLRLAPIYWTVLALTLVFSLLAGSLAGSVPMPVISSYLCVPPALWSLVYLLGTNLLIFGQDIVLFLGISPGDGHLFFTTDFMNTSPPLHHYLFIPQAWTLGIELSFYLVAPFILKRGLKPVLILILLSAGARLYIYYGLHLRDDPWSYRFFPTELLFFLLGYLSFRIYRRIQAKTFPGFLNWSLLGILILITLCYSFLPGTGHGFMQFTLKSLGYDTVLVLSLPFIFNFLRYDKRDKFIGELSYPIYISHVLVAMALGYCQSPALRSGWFIAATTVLFSCLLVKFVADPVEKYRQRRLKAVPAKPAQMPIQ